MPELLTRPSAPYREDLCRSVPFEVVRIDDGTERGVGLTIDGFGIVLNSVARISSWEGEFDEVVAPGATKKSLRERTPKMQFDHGTHPLLGSLPLGRWTTAEEEARGVHGVGRLSDNWLIEPFRDAIRDEGVTGMSMRFSVVRELWTDKDGKTVRDDELEELLWYGAGDRGPILRTLKEIRVSEMGPVTWPAYEETSVGVRSRSGTIVIDLARVHTPQVRSQLAHAVALADRRTSTTQNPDAPEAAEARPEPRSTAASAGEHPTGPRSTDAAAGEHSPTQAPSRAAIAARIRERAKSLIK